jgi:hypothetical protein
VKRIFPIILLFLSGCGEGRKVFPVAVQTNIIKRDVLAVSPKLAFNIDGEPAVVFVNQKTAQAEFGILKENEWVVSKIGISYPCLEIGKAIYTKNGLFAFTGYTFGNLTVFKKTPSGWISEIVDDMGDTGLNSDMVEDRDGGLNLSYVNVSGLDLVYARLYLGESLTETVDPGYYELVGGGEVFSTTSIALDKNMIPHISYYEGFHGVLKHAWLKEDKSGWNVEVVDSTPDRGRFNSISYSSSCDCFRIAYYDMNERNLLFAEKKGSWEIEAVDTSDLNVGKFPVLLEDNDGEPVILYLDVEDASIRMARRKNGKWKVFQISQLREDNCPVLVSEFDAKIYSGKIGIVISDLLNREVRYVEESMEVFQ